MIFDVNAVFTPGKKVFFDSSSPTADYAVIFEDDLTTGYFYAIDTNDDPRVVDALHVYNTKEWVEKNLDSAIKIVWNQNGDVAFLVIDDYCHAVFDFNCKAGYCRNGYPVSKAGWPAIRERKLTDEMVINLIDTD